jgi:hypothetical protein
MTDLKILKNRPLVSLQTYFLRKWPEIFGMKTYQIFDPFDQSFNQKENLATLLLGFCRDFQDALR